MLTERKRKCFIYQTCTTFYAKIAQTKMSSKIDHFGNMLKENNFGKNGQAGQAKNSGTRISTLNSQDRGTSTCWKQTIQPEKR